MEHDEQHVATAAAWADSAQAYIDFQDRGDRNRTVLLDPVMLQLCGDVCDIDAIDIGCGEGRFSRMLAERGARVTGIDLTPGMVRAAVERDADGAYVRGSAEHLPFGNASFDLAISYITLVDIVDFRAAVRESARVLRRGGRLIAANLSFVTASEPWVRDDAGLRLYRPIDRYAEERSQVYEWLGIRIVNWHRPLSAYMQAYLDAGLTLRDFLEPVPEDQSLRDDPSCEDWFRIPEFTVMHWEKAG